MTELFSNLMDNDIRKIEVININSFIENIMNFAIKNIGYNGEVNQPVC